MHVNKVYLQNYRNIKNLELQLQNGVNIFCGSNAQGKTNLLESIYMGATGRSHRAHKDKDLINFEYDEAHIRLDIQNHNTSDRIDIHIKRHAKKGIAINQLPINQLGELFGYLNVVIFSPEDLSLVKQGPQERRKFLDMELCQISSIYYYDILQYHKILKQRNSLLKEIAKNSNLLDTLFTWDGQLIEYGNNVIEERDKFIIRLNEISKKIHSNITNNCENLEIKYKPNILPSEFREKLEENIDRDIRYNNTSYGPHKDDILFFINGINVREFGSQGQQRTVSLSIKLAEITLLNEEKGDLPILLLDDVLSELDKSRQHFLINSIGDLQVIITCTGVEDVLKNMDKDYSIIKVSNGEFHKFLE